MPHSLFLSYGTCATAEPTRSTVAITPTTGANGMNAATGLGATLRAVMPTMIGPSTT